MATVRYQIRPDCLLNELLPGLHVKGFASHEESLAAGIQSARRTLHGLAFGVADVRLSSHGYG